MSDWSQGYVTEIGYTYGYYAELNPLRVQLALLSAGIAPPQISTACELGFGQGVSINLHAAASPVGWWGTDFNPAQVGFARTLAQASGAQPHLYEDAFEEFARRDDLPDFDYIGLHGIWAWVTDENRKTIVDFIGRKLKPGGVAYISYNTYPGWAAFMPMRNLLAQHATLMGAPGAGILRRVESALDFGDRLVATNPVYARTVPSISDRLKKLRGMQRAYVAHEYFNREWHPMHFSDVAQLLRPAKLEFSCSAQLTDLVDAVNHTQEQRNLLAEIPDPVFRETVRDLMVNQQFRRDFWVKGVRRLNEAEQAEALRRVRVVLLGERAAVSLKFTGVLGEVTMAEAVYNPILDALASNKPMTIGELEAALAGKQITFSQVRQALLMLAGAGNLQVAQDEDSIAKAAPRTAALNAHLMQRARTGGEASALASPVTGGGISVNRIGQLFLQQVAQGARVSPEELARNVWATLSAQGQRVLREGKALDRPEDNLAELHAQATAFVQKQLPVYKALQVI